LETSPYPGEEAGTNTGNPVDTDTEPAFISATPTPFTNDNLPDTFFKAILDIKGGDGALKGQDIIVSPKVLWPCGDVVFVTGGDREIQIIEQSGNSSPVFRGTFDLPGGIRDIFLNGNTAFILTNKMLYKVNIENRDLPNIIASIPLGAEVLKLYAMDSIFIRISMNSTGYTQIDSVSEDSLMQPASKGLILPAEVESETQYDSVLWLRVRLIEGNKSYIIGIDLEKLSQQSDLIDLSEDFSGELDLGQAQDLDSPVFAITEVPAIEFSEDLFDEEYFNRIMQISGIKVMDLFYGIWMNEQMYVVLDDSEIQVYDLSNNGSLVSRTPISFIPESYAVSNTELILSYLEQAATPEGGNATKSYATYFFNSTDLSDPENPQLSESINSPGFILSMDGEDILSLDFSWGENETLKESIKHSTISNGEVSLKQEYPLDQRSIGRHVAGPYITSVLSGEETTWSERIQFNHIPEWEPNNSVDENDDQLEIESMDPPAPVQFESANNDDFGHQRNEPLCNDNTFISDNNLILASNSTQSSSPFSPDIYETAENGIFADEYAVLEPNHNYELKILATPFRIQGIFVIDQATDKLTNELNTSFTLDSYPGSPAFSIIDTSFNIQEPSPFGTSVGGDGYVGTIRFTTNEDATGFTGTTGSPLDFQFDSIFNTPTGTFSLEYRPYETTQNNHMAEPVQLSALQGTLSADGTMTLIPDGRIGGLSLGPDTTGARWNVNSEGMYNSFTTGSSTNSVRTVEGNRITINDDGTFSVKLVSSGSIGIDFFGMEETSYVEVWQAIIIDLGPTSID